MLTNVWNVIKAFFDFVANLISGLIGVLTSTSRAAEFVFAVGDFLPPILFGCIVATIAILVIKFILGR